MNIKVLKLYGLLGALSVLPTMSMSAHAEDMQPNATVMDNQNGATDPSAQASEDLEARHRGWDRGYNRGWDRGYNRGPRWGYNRGHRRWHRNHWECWGVRFGFLGWRVCN